MCDTLPCRRGGVTLRCPREVGAARPCMSRDCTHLLVLGLGGLRASLSSLDLLAEKGKALPVSILVSRQ